MEGVIFKEITKMNAYGYRIVLNAEVCTINEKKNTKREKEVLRIYPFNEMCKLKIYFVKEKKLIEVNWIQIQAKEKQKGIILFYENDEIIDGKEILAWNLQIGWHYASLQFL